MGVSIKWVELWTHEGQRVLVKRDDIIDIYEGPFPGQLVVEVGNPKNSYIVSEISELVLQIEE